MDVKSIAITKEKILLTETSHGGGWACTWTLYLRCDDSRNDYDSGGKWTLELHLSMELSDLTN